MEREKRRGQSMRRGGEKPAKEEEEASIYSRTKHCLLKRISTRLKIGNGFSQTP